MKSILEFFSGIGLLTMLACSSGGYEIIRPDPSELFDLTYDASTYLVADNFTAVIDNPYFSQIPGTSRTFQGQNEGREPVVVTEEVLTNTKSILGISCNIVRVMEWENGALTEETFDYYAQDKDGNVWYFGEAVDIYENGQVVAHDGAWEAGMDGAMAGIVMPGAPVVGLKYRQEFFMNEAEDLAEIIGINEVLTTGLGTYREVIKTKEWSPLAPNTEEYKFYGSGPGLLRVESLSNASFEELTD